MDVCNTRHVCYALYDLHDTFFSFYATFRLGPTTGASTIDKQ